jgi:hypothetical protein
LAAGRTRPCRAIATTSTCGGKFLIAILYSYEVSDKLLAKQFAVARCPTVKVPETLWTGQAAEDIPDDLLRGNVVVKANHGSGWNIFIRNGQYDRGELNRTANRWLASRFGKRHAEWGYSCSASLPVRRGDAAGQG